MRDKPCHVPLKMAASCHGEGISHRPPIIISRTSDPSSSDVCFSSGETEYNRQRIIQGQKDVGLSDVGSNQAELVAKRLSSERFNLVFSSDLSRAKKVQWTL